MKAIEALSKFGSDIGVISIDEDAGTAEVHFYPYTIIKDYPLMNIRYEGGLAELVKRVKANQE